MPIILLKKEDNPNIIQSFDVGEHILGRDSVLECSSKRVSRRHGLLKITSDGEIFLQSTHNNPCFHKLKLSEHICVVNFGNTVQISHNDKIALSLDHGWYIVQIKDINIDDEDVPSEANTNKVQDIIGETPNKKRKLEESNIIATENGKLSVVDTTITFQRNEKSVVANVISTENFTNKDLDDIDKSPNRKRKLEEANIIIPSKKEEQSTANTTITLQQNEKATKADISKEKLENTQQSESVNTNVPFPIIRPESAGQHDAKLPQFSSIVKVENVPSDNQNPTSEISIKQEPDCAAAATVKQEPGIVKEECCGGIWNIPQMPSINIDIIRLPQMQNVPLGVVPPQSHNRQGDSDAESRPSTSGVNRRPWRDRCWYGANCYRKNAEHRSKIKHPGDSDFDSDPDDPRPICCYGVGCYRKNREHRKKYRHPGQKSLATKPQSPRKRRTVKPSPKPQTHDSNDEDDYDYSDPFINDGSSDEYIPSSDTESEYEDSQEAEEDNKRLLREAQKFTRNQK